MSQIGRAETESGGKLIADAYGAEWKVPLGRVDSDVPGAAGRIPSVDAPIEEIKAYFLQLGMCWFSLDLVWLVGPS